VKRSFERLLSPESESWGCSLFDMVEGYAAWRAHESSELTGVVVKDDLTVEFHLARADAAFLDRLAMPLASVIPVEVVTTVGGTAFAAAPLGSGPFELEHREMGTRIVLRRNPDYFRPDRPYLDRIVLDVNVPSQLENMRFRRGDVDLSWGEPFTLDPAWRPYVRRTPKPSIWAVVMNLRFPPWDDVHVRRAVAFALDRAELTRASRGVDAPLGTDMPEQDARRRRPERARCRDVVELFDLHRLGSNEAAHPGPREKTQHQEEDPDAGPRHRLVDGHDHDEEREGHERVDEAHEDRVHDAPEVAGDDADERPDEGDEDRGGYPDGERDAAAVEQARQLAAAERVGPERELAARTDGEAERIEGGCREGDVRSVWRQERRGERKESDQGHDDGADHRSPVSCEAAPGRGSRRQCHRVTLRGSRARW
jgi:hypothetical protein